MVVLVRLSLTYDLPANGFPMMRIQTDGSSFMAREMSITVAMSSGEAFGRDPRGISAFDLTI